MYLKKLEIYISGEPEIVFNNCKLTVKEFFILIDTEDNTTHVIELKKITKIKKYNN